jgi:CO/xanthine dehydrogenase Mo-binding subunit
MAEGAPRLHPKGNLLSETKVMKRGNVYQAIAAAKYVVTQHYSTPRQEHAFLEPESALAVPGADRSLTVYTAGQGVYDDHRGIVEMLGVPDEKVRVISKLVGGGFGGKEDLSVQHHAALLAWHSGRPVKLTFSRAESFRVHPKRHPMEIDLTTASDANGKITAVKARIVADTGAYASLGGPVLQRACTHAAGPYQIDNVDIEGRAIYTNNIPSGAFRGFGVTQTCFAMESNLNLLAAQAGISPWEIRFRNAIEPGGVSPTARSPTPAPRSRRRCSRSNVIDAHPNAGIACAFKNSGKGVGVPDVGRVKLKVHNGRVVICTSAACMGQGLATVLVQIVAEASGLPQVRDRRACTGHHGHPEQRHQHGIAPDPDHRRSHPPRCRCAAAGTSRAHACRAGRQRVLREYDCVTDPMTSDKSNRFEPRCLRIRDAGRHSRRRGPCKEGRRRARRRQGHQSERHRRAD